MTATTPKLDLRRFPAEDRFWSQIVVVESCWTWTAGQNSAGYGIMEDKAHRYLAHRWAYERFRGPIPAGLTIDHLCRNRLCVNPEHMEAVTNRENILRGEGITATAARATACKLGHPLDGMRRNGARYCRTCSRMANRSRAALAAAEGKEAQ
jgi:hypothetical protein